MMRRPMTAYLLLLAGITSPARGQQGVGGPASPQQASCVVLVRAITTAGDTLFVNGCVFSKPDQVAIPWIVVMQAQQIDVGDSIEKTLRRAAVAVSDSISNLAILRVPGLQVKPATLATQGSTYYELSVHTMDRSYAVTTSPAAMNERDLQYFNNITQVVPRSQSLTFVTGAPVFTNGLYLLNTAQDRGGITRGFGILAYPLYYLEGNAPTPAQQEGRNYMRDFAGQRIIQAPVGTRPDRVIAQAPATSVAAPPRDNPPVSAQTLQEASNLCTRYAISQRARVGPQGYAQWYAQWNSGLRDICVQGNAFAMTWLERLTRAECERRRVAYARAWNLGMILVDQGSELVAIKCY